MIGLFHDNSLELGVRFVRNGGNRPPTGHDPDDPAHVRRAGWQDSASWCPGTFDAP